MNNALKHGLPSKPISIECNQNNGFLSISVHNESKKIPEDILNSIFNRYYKVKDSTKGWGIGLAFVKKVAEAHGGKVLVDSTSNGTTFILEIPVVSGSRQ
jgi:signal transduction histidine kinase